MVFSVKKRRNTAFFLCLILTGGTKEHNMFDRVIVKTNERITDVIYKNNIARVGPRVKGITIETSADAYNDETEKSVKEIIDFFAKM